MYVHLKLMLMGNFRLIRFYFFILILTVGCNKKAEIVKIPTEYKRKNSEGVVNQRIYFFAVKNKNNNLINNYSIKFKNNIEDISKIYLELIFYEYNSKLNENSVYGEGDDTIYHNGKYLICSFKWDKGRFLGKYIYEDGALKEIVYPLPSSRTD